MENFAAHVVAGGVGEVIAGGKFANGAMTGAFAWLYNHARDLEKRGAGSAGGDGLRRSGNQPHTRGDDSDPRVRQQAKNEALQAVADVAIMIADAIQADIQASTSKYDKGRYNVSDEVLLRQKFDRYTVGGVRAEWDGYPGVVRKLPDGTEIGLREASKFDGKPAIDFKFPGTNNRWRIHIGK